MQSLEEVESGITEMKYNKACDINGNSPGLSKWFTPMLIIFLINMFNVIFQGNYNI